MTCVVFTSILRVVAHCDLYHLHDFEEQIGKNFTFGGISFRRRINVSIKICFNSTSEVRNGKLMNMYTQLLEYVKKSDEYKQYMIKRRRIC